MLALFPTCCCCCCCCCYLMVLSEETGFLALPHRTWQPFVWIWKGAANQVAELPTGSESDCTLVFQCPAYVVGTWLENHGMASLPCTRSGLSLPVLKITDMLWPTSVSRVSAQPRFSLQPVLGGPKSSGTRETSWGPHMVERLYHHLTSSEYSNKETSFSVDTYQLQCVLKLFWQLVKT